MELSKCSFIEHSYSLFFQLTGDTIVVQQINLTASYYIFLKTFTEADDAARERDQIRDERHRERQRERNINRAAPERRYVAYSDRIAK